MASKSKTDKKEEVEKKNEDTPQESPAEKKTTEEDSADYTGEKKEKEEKTEEDSVKDEKTIESSDSESTEQEITDNSQEGNGSRKKKWIILIIVILLSFGILGGIFLFSQGIVKFELSLGKSTPAPTPALTLPTITPEPTEKKEVNLGEYTIEVLNGSGIAGEAALVKGDLEDEGFEVNSVGNADESNYEETVIFAKKDVSDGFLGELKDFLKKRGPVGGIKILDESEETDVIVIIGQKSDTESTSNLE